MTMLHCTHCGQSFPTELCKSCPVCGRFFVAKRRDAVFCTGQCRQWAFRRRRLFDFRTLISTPDPIRYENWLHSVVMQQSGRDGSALENPASERVHEA